MLPDNNVAYQMYELVSSQWIIAGMGEPVALNYSTVLSVLQIYIKNEDEIKDCFDKIVFLSQLDLKLLRKKK